MRRRLTSFQKLALWTTATTYLLILVGGLVRASGAGLGCPDWPRCFGSWVPPASAAELPAGFDPSQFNLTLMWTEYLNRVLGVTVGLLIFATLVSAFRHHRHTSRIVWPTLSAFLLVGFQGWLGGVVVQHELAPWIVTVHLIVALIIVSLLLYATVYAFFVDESTPLSAGGLGVRTGSPESSRLASIHLRRGGLQPRTEGTVRGPLVWSTLALIAITLGQVALGAQVRSGIDDAILHGAPRAQALASVGAFDMWHREAALVVLGATILVVLLVWNNHVHEQPLLRTAYVMAALVVAQIAIGASMAYLTLTPVAQIAHLTVSSLLLGAETLLLLLAAWLPVSE